jgi:RND family efflux transporter MFP subunit
MPLRALTLALACALLSAPAWAVEVHGFLEPYRTVDVATTETGIMIQLLVRVGDPIGEGEVIAQLDDDVHQILVETAKAKTEAQGRLASAQAELKLRKYRLAKLAELIEQGHGRREEVERAAADAEIAEAQILDAKDDLLLRTLELRRLEVELERRKIRSPLSGVVSENLKEVGEYLAPNDPEIVTIVQLNPLLARFSMRPSQAKSLELGQYVQLGLPNLTDTLTGMVEEISPVIDAESGTVRVRVRLENPDGYYDSGQRCVLHLPEMQITAETDNKRQRPLWGRSQFAKDNASGPSLLSGDR